MEILKDIPAAASKRITPFIEEILSAHRDNIDSIYIVGSAVTDSFDASTSDINTLFVLKESDFILLDYLASLGKNYSKNGIAAPLIMTPQYIKDSLDTFPIEFIDIKHIHKTVYGSDIFSDISIKREDLRLQCERELKGRVVGLRQGYIHSKGEKDLLSEFFIKTIAGYFPLFRGVIFLLSAEYPVNKSETLSRLNSLTQVDTSVFNTVLELKKGKVKSGKEQLKIIFESYYRDIEKLGKLVNEIS